MMTMFFTVVWPKKRLPAGTCAREKRCQHAIDQKSERMASAEGVSSLSFAT